MHILSKYGDKVSPGEVVRLIFLDSIKLLLSKIVEQIDPSIFLNIAFLWKQSQVASLWLPFWHEDISFE